MEWTAHELLWKPFYRWINRRKNNFEKKNILINIQIFGVFIFRFLQMRSPRIRSRLLVPTVQCVFLLFAALCSVSRITDHRHHWWDVLIGASIGTLFAVFAVNIQFNIFSPFLCKNFNMKTNQKPFSSFPHPFSRCYCAKTSKWKKCQTLSQCYKIVIQSTIGTHRCVVFCLNEPKMNWIWITLWFHRKNSHHTRCNFFLVRLPRFSTYDWS